MSEDEIQAAVLFYLRGNSPASTRAVRAAVKARGVLIDAALRSLLSARRVTRTDEGWYRLYADGTRYGHDAYRVRPSGVQASYFKAVDKVAAGIVAEFDVDPSQAGWLAREWLREALPKRQRQRLTRGST